MNQEIKIEEGIAIPPKRGETFPFSQMKIGDSFFVMSDYKTKLFNASQVFSRKNKDFKFTMRKVKDGFRIWRIPKDGK